MHQRLGVVLAGELGVLAQQLLGGRDRAEAFEVHREGRDVTDHVAVPQAGVEVEAVEHPGPVGQAEDVVGEQVAVAVADGPTGGAPAQERGAPDQVGVDQRPGLLEVVVLERVPGVGQRVQAHHPELAQPVGAGDPVGEGDGAHRECRSAIRRASRCTCPLTSAPASTRALRRVAPGSRRMTTTCSRTLPSSRRSASTPR